MSRSVIAIIVVVGLLSGCVSTTTTDVIEAKPEVVRSIDRYVREYALAPGDVIEVAIYRHDNLSRDVHVRADGFISLPLLDEVYVSGMSLRQVDDYLTEKLAERLADPEVTVIIKNPQEPMVFVVGEVQAAQPVPLRRARTAAQAITYVGGMRKSAKMDVVSVVRLDDEGYLTAIIIEDETSGQPGFYMALQNMHLQAGDLVVVPESKRYQFFRYLNDALGAINQVLTPYFQYRLLDEVIRRNDALLD